MNWQAFRRNPVAFATNLLGQELTPQQRQWLRQIGEADQRVGLVYKRRYVNEMMTVLTCAALWRGLVHKQHSQVVVSVAPVGLAWLRAMGVTLSRAKLSVRNFMQCSESGWITRDNIAIWRIAAAHPNNLSLKVQGCDLFVGDFDRIPRDLLAATFEADLGGLTIFPTSSGKWPHHM